MPSHSTVQKYVTRLRLRSTSQRRACCATQTNRCHLVDKCPIELAFSSYDDGPFKNVLLSPARPGSSLVCSETWCRQGMGLTHGAPTLAPLMHQ